VSVKKRAIYHQWTEYSCSLCARFVGCSWHQFCDEHYITCYVTCSVRVVCTRPKGAYRLHNVHNAIHLLNNFIISPVYIHVFCCFRKRLYSFRRIAWMLMKPVASLGVKSECLSMETRSSLYKETGDHRPKTVTKTYSSW
jgi:hypothetical protein